MIAKEGKHAANKEEQIMNEIEKDIKNDLDENIKTEEVQQVSPLQELQEKYDKLEDIYKRHVAEFDNYQKRSEKERINLYNDVKADVFEEILPVVDNLEKALETETTDEKFKEGIALIYNQMKKALEDNGVEEIPAEIGMDFDPSSHEAVQSVEDKELGEGKIKQVYRKGYKIGTKILRHSMVVVSI